jgi:hypothetical protein
VERWRDDSRTWNWRRPLSGEDSEVIADFDDEDHGPGTGPVAWGSRDENADLIVAAVSILLDEGSGVAAILRDAIRERSDMHYIVNEWTDRTNPALLLAGLVNRIEATR